ncbi:hypothetical protein [Comamonas antarctica]|uniref:M17 aminopeptidase N-terminal domain-containing protein n=1 Tax=Comamonas antarctica TaxID=2743470 RepID=A0A6N1WXR3_9BURK|nr:hypothetical protein [Comamonas antarctica]QKV51438.1 hypothetical protein HUK68_00215 [Comamonas antarctica]
MTSATTAAFAPLQAAAIPVHLCTPAALPALREAMTLAQRQWGQSSGFDASPARVLLLPDAGGVLDAVLAGVDLAQPMWQLAGLPRQLPAGVYALAGEARADDALRHLGWALKAAQPAPQLREHEAAAGLAGAIAEVRQLVNQPANQLGPEALAAAVRQLAVQHGGQYREWAGEALRGAGFELVWAMGRAGALAWWANRARASPPWRA